MNRVVYLVAEGGAHIVDTEMASKLKAHRGCDQVLDMTPRPFQQTMFGPVMPFTEPQSTARLIPCPWCTERNPKTGDFRYIERVTHCSICNDAKVAVVCGMWPNAALLLQPVEKPKKASLLPA